MRAFILLCALINILSAQTAHSFSYMYHNYANLTQLMNYYASTYPNVTFLYSVGKSVQGRELWTLALAKNNPNMHVPLRPEAKYIGAMHGNEVPSKEILISLIDHMLTNQADPDVDYLLSNTRVHIMPSMNPDGYETAILGDCDGVTGRQNANNYDLNRNFPDIFENNTAPIQPETRAVMNWLEREDFVVSANFHGGTMVVNYPFDSLKNFNSSSGSVYSKTNDDDVFISMAKNYSYNHLQMRDSSAAQCGNEFTDGITNGGR
jgi:murein tripeptide amidase MpaA